MSDLQPCTQCQRHVRSDDDACPFCDASITTKALRPSLAPGRLTRAAVFAGAIGAIGACTKEPEPSKAEPPKVSDAAPKAAPASDAAPPDAAVADAAIPDAAPPDAAPPDAAPKKKKKRRRRAKPDAAVVKFPKADRHMIPKPYGAPPARRRLV